MTPNLQSNRLNTEVGILCYSLGLDSTLFLRGTDESLQLTRRDPPTALSVTYSKTAAFGVNLSFQKMLEGTSALSQLLSCAYYLADVS